jgi:Trk K+ transport system NAD-binding subunit
MPTRPTLYAWWKYGNFLAREFRFPGSVFVGLILGVGLLFSLAYRDNGPLGYGEACYAVFLMVFAQNYLKFSSNPWLQPFFFLVPIVGLGAVADSVVRLGYFIFTSKQKLPEWHRMKASAMRNHIVLCGVGKVGYRILQELLVMKEEVVAIERNADNPLVTEMIDKGVTIIIGEARLRKTLEAANVQAAKAIILATDDDLANIDSALTAREIKPEIRVVLRLFDDTLASKVAPAFKMPAISTSATAASAFICAVTERNIFQSMQLGPHRLHVADLIVSGKSRLKDRTVGDVQKEFKVNIVMHLSGERTSVNPEHGNALRPEDHLLVVAPIDDMVRLEEANR